MTGAKARRARYDKLWHTMTNIFLQKIISTDPEPSIRKRAAQELELRLRLQEEAK